MAEPQTWRELLGIVIKDPTEVQRIRSEIGVHKMTLTRWSTGESTPRSYLLQNLLNALPKHREQLVRLMAQEKEGLLTQEDSPREIPASFYAHVLRAVSVTPEPESARFWAICNTILQQALQLIDPERLGVELAVIRCIRGEDNYVRCLQESMTIGRPPWSSIIVEKKHFLGVESLAGQVVSEGHQVVIQSIEDNNSFSNASQYALGMAASPISVASRISGCLLVSSAIPHFFISNRLELISAYADLLLHAFQREDFCDPRFIDLRSMPSFQEQEPYLMTFHQRVADILRSAARREDLISKGQAEDIVRRQIIDTLTAIGDTTLIDD